MNDIIKEEVVLGLLAGIQDPDLSNEERIKAWQKTFDFIKLPIIVCSTIIDKKEHYCYECEDEKVGQTAVEFEKNLRIDLRLLYNFQNKIKKIEEYLEKYSNSNK